MMNDPMGWSARGQCHLQGLEHQLGWAHHQVKTLASFRAAKAAFEQAVQLDPGYAGGWGALAELYFHAQYRGLADELGIDMGEMPSLIEKARRLLGLSESYSKASGC